MLLPADTGAEINLETPNIAKAQSYLYDIWHISEKHLLVGSSLTNKIVEDSISSTFVNLGLEGMSVFDGLKIIQQKNVLPKSIFIEVNLLYKEDNPKFQHLLFNPFNYYSSKYLPSSRNQNKPVETLKRVAFELYRQLVPKGPMQEEKKPIGKSQMQQLKQFYNKEISDSIIIKNFNLLEQHINKLHEQGVYIVFYELPFHPNLCNAKMLLQFREEIYKRFSPKDFNYLLQPNCREYLTLDGIHLDNPSSIKYASFLRKKVEELGIGF